MILPINYMGMTAVTSTNISFTKPNDMLMVASKHNLIDYVRKALLKGADLNFKNGEGRTALMEASRYGHYRIVQYLIEKGANLNNTDKSKMTAIMLAINYGHLCLANYLFEEGAQVIIEDKFINSFWKQ